MNKQFKINYNNPLIEQRADPWIYLHHDGYYYFTSSVPEYDRIELRRSKTINGLKDAETVDVWQKHNDGEMSCLIWAHELHYIDRKWYLYFAASHTMEVLDHRNFLLECCDENPLSGNWEEKGKIDTGWDTFALDATAFVHEKQQYLVWAQQDLEIEEHSNIYIAAMENPWTLKQKVSRLSIPEYEWERRGFCCK